MVIVLPARNKSSIKIFVLFGFPLPTVPPHWDLPEQHQIYTWCLPSISGDHPSLTPHIILLTFEEKADYSRSSSRLWSLPLRRMLCVISAATSTAQTMESTITDNVKGVRAVGPGAGDHGRKKNGQQKNRKNYFHITAPECSLQYSDPVRS